MPSQLPVWQPAFPVWNLYSCVNASSTYMSSLQENLQEKTPGFSLGCEEGTHMNVQSAISTRISFLLIFVMFPTAILNTIISEAVVYHSPITTGARQCRSTQTGSSAFRKYHCDKAPETNWNSGKDKQCSRIMLWKHKKGIISRQCWEKANRNILNLKGYSK